MITKSTARIIGFLYLFTILTPVLGNALFDERQLNTNDIPTTLQLIADHSFKYQLSISLDFLTIVGVMALAFSLYALLKHVDHFLAWLALGWRIGEVLLQAGGTIPNYLLLTLNQSTGSGAGNVDAAGSLLIAGANEAVWLSFVFFSLGSLFNNYLFFKGKLIPGNLAMYGLISTVLYAVGSIVALIIEVPETTNIVMMIPLVLFELSLGFYLVFFNLKEIPVN